MTDEELLTIRGTKEESKTLRWLHKAKGDEDRHILTAWHRRGPITACCDGFRIHAAEIPHCLKDLPDTNESGQGNYAGRIFAGDFTAALEIVEGHYPDISQVAPNGEIIAEVPLDPKFLKQAVQGFSNEDSVILRIYERGDSSSISLHSREDASTKHYALIMPREMEEDSAWTPQMFRGKQGGEEKEGREEEDNER